MKPPETRGKGKTKKFSLRQIRVNEKSLKDSLLKFTCFTGTQNLPQKKNEKEVKIFYK